MGDTVGAGSVSADVRVQVDINLEQQNGGGYQKDSRYRAQRRIDILNNEKRPVSAVADDLEVRDVERVEIAEDRNISVTMLFDAGHSLDERVLAEQFGY